MGRHEKVLQVGLIDLYDIEEKELEYWGNNEKGKENLKNFPARFNSSKIKIIQFSEKAQHDD
jgi:hypothetical protein